jgi:outer membrane protein OmpA-like peptidoglycan-associated protein
MIRTRLSIHAAVVATGALSLLSLAHAQEDGSPPGRPLPGRAGDFTLKLEPGVAIPLTKPQSERFNVGGGQTVKALWLLTEQLDIGPSVTFISLPSEADDESGTAWTFGGSLRFKRSHNVAGEGFEAISPWADADLLYVRTGKLNRPGAAIAAGLAVPVGEARVFWIGPFVRYLHILQGDPAGYDNHDAKILSLGLSIEVGPGVRREREAAPVAAAAAPVEPKVVEKQVFVCEDRDKDDIPDKVDHCPDVAGPMDAFGCPEYKKVVVTKDKLELKEKLFFAWNQATLKEVSYPVLDEVAQALKDNKGFKVQVEGHASAEGGNERNQTLSEQRAHTVVEYLVSKGVERERLVSSGKGASVPIDTNATPAGREANRRVQFVVNFSILNDGSK